jgi:hypothetical protein
MTRALYRNIFHFFNHSELGTKVLNQIGDLTQLSKYPEAINLARKTLQDNPPVLFSNLTAPERMRLRGSIAGNTERLKSVENKNLYKGVPIKKF